MQTIRVTHVTHRPNSTTMMEHSQVRTEHLPLPKGAQPPKIQLRNDLPFSVPKRKNVLRKNSKSSSSTTVTTIASTTSSSNHSNNPNISFSFDSQNTPAEPGCDPLLDRLRYDLSYPPPPPKSLPSPNTESEDHFEAGNTRIRASWSDSGHLTRQNTFSALFVSPSSSSSSSETGHHDSGYHSQIHFRTRTLAHAHAHTHGDPHSMPMSYHLPSRRINTVHARSTAPSDDLQSLASHSTKPNLPRKSSLSWLRHPLELFRDKAKPSEDPQDGIKRTASVSLSVEPKLRSQQLQNERNTRAFSSSVSESGHVFVIPTEEMDTSPSRAQRKLKKRPPSAWNPVLPNTGVAVPLSSSSRRTSLSIQPVNQRPVPNPHSHVPPLPSGLGNTDQPQGAHRYRHAVYGNRNENDHNMIITRARHVHTNLVYQQHKTTSEVNTQLWLNGEHPHPMSISLNDSPVISTSRNTSEFPPQSMLPPLRVQSPLRIRIPPIPAPSPPLSEAFRCKSAPNLTIKKSDGTLRPFTNNMSSTTSNGFNSVSGALVQSPISTSPTADSSFEGQFSQLSPVSSPIPPGARPSFLRSPSNRRWTLAVSETPEDELVEELERLRRTGWALGFQGELVKIKGEEVSSRSTDLDAESMKLNGGMANGYQASSSSLGNAPSHVKWRKEEMEEWLIARKALLVCREIVRTEKTYRESLETLQRGETLDPPSPLLLQYLPALISASYAFCASLAEDPSAWGVSAAFLSNEEALEAAFVAWSGVVGEFFGKGNDHDEKARERNSIAKRTGRRISLGFDRITMAQNSTRTLEVSKKGVERGRRAGKLQPQSPDAPTPALASSSTWLNQSASTSLTVTHTGLWRRSMPSLHLALLPGHGNTQDTMETNGSNTKTVGSKAPSLSSHEIASFSPFSISRKSWHSVMRFTNGTNGTRKTSAHGNAPTSKTKVPAVRDLAIQPVQRVVRYVLLYKDLFNSTPETSPSRALVECALKGASRIAQRCNRAQDNAAFLL